MGRMMSRAESSACALHTTAFTVVMAPGAAFRACALQLASGEVVGVAGSNGAGKTTLLRALAGEVRPTDGRMWIFDREITQLDASARARAGLCLLPQENHVFLNLSVAENLRVATDSSEARRTSTDELRRLLPGLDFRTPARLLSGGERQTLALVMTFATAAQIYLIDEPYAGLDPVRAEAVRKAIRNWLKDRSAAALIVDHDLGRLTEDCHRVVAISDIAKLDFA
jgi:ABC-type branched-subunit amino acid transport system ATPase component